MADGSRRRRREHPAVPSLPDHGPINLHFARCCHVSSAEELLAALPEARPLDSGAYHTSRCGWPPLVARWRIFRFPAGMFRQLERWTWKQLYNLPSHLKSGKKTPALADATGNESMQVKEL